jgi:Ca2+-binding EF-hand superfamily protein
MTCDKEDLEKYFEHYNSFTKTDGKIINDVEFQKSLGVFGLNQIFSKFIFSILSPDKAESVDFYNFISTISILLHGDFEQRSKRKKKFHF